MGHAVVNHSVFIDECGYTDSFPDIMANPLSTLDEEDYNKWGARHKKNLLLDAPIGQEDEEENCSRKL